MPAKHTAKTFRAVLEPLDDNLGWIVVWLPFDAAKAWPEMVRLRVIVQVGSEQFRSSLFPARNTKRSGHFLLVNKKMQRAAGGIGPGGIIECKIWPDIAERKAAMPPDLATALKGARPVAKWFDTKLNDAAKYAIAKWMDEARTAATRTRRAEQLAERLMATMEAEADLPPQIALALGRTPGALAGWHAMTELQRRNELMAVFYYQSPESRTKRIAKLVTLATSKI